MTFKPGAGEAVYAVRAEAVPVLITAYRLGRGDYRIMMGRGIGWAPKRYASERDVLAALLPMASYTQAEARMAKEVCSKEP
jgi:hypothetical protein